MAVHHCMMPAGPSQPNVELMELLISKCPDLLLYARAENHGIWVKFLRERQHLWTVAYQKGRLESVCSSSDCSLQQRYLTSSKAIDIKKSYYSK
eukprot:scaffold146441_cov61-Attheya_sp.AAC.1